MTKYRRVSIEVQGLAYHATWVREGTTARVVGAYETNSAEIADGESGEDVAKLLLTELVAKWWSKIRATVGPGEQLPLNEMVTGDTLLFAGSGRFTGLKRDVVTEGGKVFAVTPPDGEDDGPDRIAIDPEKATEVLGDDTLRTGVWLYTVDPAIRD